MAGRWDRLADWFRSRSAYRAIPSTAELPSSCLDSPLLLLKPSSATERSLPAVDQSLAATALNQRFKLLRRTLPRRKTYARFGLPHAQRKASYSVLKDRFPRGFGEATKRRLLTLEPIFLRSGLLTARMGFRSGKNAHQVIDAILAALLSAGIEGSVRRGIWKGTSIRSRTDH